MSLLSSYAGPGAGRSERAPREFIITREALISKRLVKYCIRHLHRGVWTSLTPHQARLSSRAGTSSVKFDIHPFGSLLVSAQTGGLAILDSRVLHCSTTRTLTLELPMGLEQHVRFKGRSMHDGQVSKERMILADEFSFWTVLQLLRASNIGTYIAR